MISPRLERFFIEYFRLTLLNENKVIVNKVLNKKGLLLNNLGTWGKKCQANILVHRPLLSNRNILKFFFLCGKSIFPVEPAMFIWRKSELAW
jgi:hypothetical protein